MLKTIYIADDNAVDRMILQATLQKMGFEVTAFSSGIAIYEALRKADQPLIALLDWLMPDRNGVDICNDLSLDPPQSPLHTIIVTSRTDKSDVAFALENGADDFVAKPLDLAELRARINVGIRLLTFRQQLLDSNERLLDHTKIVEELAAARAEQLIRADRLSTIGILSAGIAHEINNPTSFVSVNIQTLEENLPVLNSAMNDYPSEEQKQMARFFLATFPEIVGEMKNGIARIRNIVNGLKTYAYAGPEKHDWFIIDDCIESALQLCANRLKYHVTVRKQFAAPLRVHGDKYQIEQVFVNLFTNAADAIEETGTDGTLELSTEYSNEKVIVSIHDTGPGIPAGALEKIFMPFYTTKAIGKGTGLGLSISKNIITDHKGELIVENHPGGGALFLITLPTKKEGTV